MKHILFVDDEPRILQGLRNLLRRYRHSFQMDFAVGGEEAIRKLDQASFHVIVTDMRMPVVDGAKLLRHAQEKHPHVVRIVLSGHADTKAALRALPVSHQFLSKPCDAKTLERAVARACDLTALIDDQELRQCIGQIDRLPSTPTIYTELNRVLSDPNVSAKDVAGVLEKDMAMCAKVLQLVNSSFFRLARTISKVEEAVAYLGFEMVRNLALSVEVFSAKKLSIPGFSMERLQQHSLACGRIASRIAPSPDKREECFIAGMLHDVGYLILAEKLPAQLQRIYEISSSEKRPLHLVERELLGVTHSEIGAYLLGAWGLPYPVVEAVANHHEPDRVEQTELDVLGAVFIANELVNETDRGEESRDRLEAYARSLGLSDRLTGWREAAQESRQAPAPAG